MKTQTLKEIVIERVGTEMYNAYCAKALWIAQQENFARGGDYDYRNAPRSEFSDEEINEIPYQIDDILWDESQEPLPAKIRTFFEIYEEMPNYHSLVAARWQYADWAQAPRAYYWESAISLLGRSDQALLRPWAYDLWCNWFEDSELIEEVWAVLGRPDLPPNILREVLIASGPVPWHMKSKLYKQLLDKPEWHYYIYRSILHSVFDLYGSYDGRQAAAFLKLLKLDLDSRETKDLENLERCLKEHGSGKPGLHLATGRKDSV